MSEKQQSKEGEGPAGLAPGAEQQQEMSAEQQGGRRGRPQTAWHPMFAQVTQLHLPAGYRMLTEYQLNLEPQRIDILIWEEDAPAGPLEGLPALMDRLTARNLLEFKSPTDDLERIDYAMLHGYAYSYYVKEQGFAIDELSLFLIGPNITDSFREGLSDYGVRCLPVEHGVTRLESPFKNCWCLESDLLWKTKGHEALGFFCKGFVKDPAKMAHVPGISHHLYTLLVQQLAHNLRRQKKMPLLHEDLLKKSLEELEREFYASQTIEQRLTGISAEELAKALPPEERIKGLPPEERIKGLSPEELELLKKLLS
jgi:hypothetical protein